MTGIEQPGDASMEPSWSVETLADLHAGALDEATATELWSRVKADPDALALLGALDRVRADLTALAELPPPAIPADVAARIDAALAAEAPPARVSPLAPVVDITAARRRRNRRLGWAAGLVAAAAAVVGIALAVVPGNSDPGSNVAGAPPGATGSGAPVAIFGSNVDGRGAGSALGVALARKDYGPLSGATRLTACLFANGIAPGVQPAGATPVVLNGKPAELLVLTTGRVAQFRLLVVGPSCGVNGAQKMADTVVGGLPTIPPTH